MSSPTINVSRPQLLVSVRDVAEARSALSGGCDILDVKEPGRGPLGMADVETIAEILDDVRAGQTPAEIPVSAALGEVVDWPAHRGTATLPAGLDYVKLGLAGIGRDADWRRLAEQVRQRFEEASETRFRWIAVAYADWEPACAPPIGDVVRWAVTAGCAGLLVDTHIKNDRTLLNSISLNDLERLSAQVHNAGLHLAVAGRLHVNLLPDVVGAEPDIIAIRTAGCRDGHRSAEIDARAVRDFKASLTAASGKTTRIHAGTQSQRIPSTAPPDELSAR